MLGKDAGFVNGTYLKLSIVYEATSVNVYIMPHHVYFMLNLKVCHCLSINLFVTVEEFFSRNSSTEVFVKLFEQRYYLIHLIFGLQLKYNVSQRGLLQFGISLNNQSLRQRSKKKCEKNLKSKSFPTEPRCVTYNEIMHVIQSQLRMMSRQLQMYLRCYPRMLQSFSTCYSLFLVNC